MPDVGAIYMIGVSGPPSACLDETHIEFSWTEGSGSLTDGSVTTTEILDGTIEGVDIGVDAVTTTEILDGTIATLDIGADAVTSAEISDGTVASVDLVTDAVGSSSIVDGSVTSADITDGTIAAVDSAAGAVDASFLGLEVVSVERSLSSATFNNVTVACPTGKSVVSGGYRLSAISGGSTSDFTTLQNRPASATD